MEKFKKILPSLIFNIAETAIIVLMGMMLNVPINYIILVMLTFMITRALFTEFAQKMIQEVDSPEAKQIIKKHLRKISQMSGM